VARRWDGGSWTDTGVPDLPGSNREAFVSVSCPAANFCAAAGVAGTISLPGAPATPSSEPLAATWDGAAWKLVAQPRPAGTTRAEFLSVSCADPRWCVAVGASPYGDRPGQGRLPVTAVWRDADWYLGPPLPPPPGRELALTSVSCRERQCLALSDRPEMARYAPGS